MKKVYCSNCKFFYRVSTYLIIANWPKRFLCRHKSNIKIRDTYLKRSIIVKKSPDILNKDNNCLDYVKCWWKFWVK